MKEELTIQGMKAHTWLAGFNLNLYSSLSGFHAVNRKPCGASVQQRRGNESLFSFWSILFFSSFFFLAPWDPAGEDLECGSSQGV